MANPNIIPYLHYQDIQIPDVAIRTQFKTYWNQAQYAQAINLLTSSGLSGKAYLAEVINTLTNGVNYLESQYDTNVTGFLASALNHYQFLIDSFKSRYVWNAGVSYILFNFVTYNNESYMALGDVPVGTPPTDDTYWLQLNLLGDKGDKGIDVNLRYNWSNSLTYNVNDVVVYNNTLYVAIANNTNITPGTDSNTWIVFVDFAKGTIAVSLTAPTSPTEGVIWLQPSEDPSTVTETTAQFWLYNQQLGDWVEMYPFTVKSQVDGYEAICPSLNVLNYTITSDDWVGVNTWQSVEANNTTWQDWESQGITWADLAISEYKVDYSIPTLTDSSFVKILLGSNPTVLQKQLFNMMKLSIEGTTVTLTAYVQPDTDLPIRIIVQ